jgi:hypothetical protein
VAQSDERPVAAVDDLLDRKIGVVRGEGLEAGGAEVHEPAH